MKHKSILLAIAAIILIPLFFATRSQAGQAVKANTQAAAVTNVPLTSSSATPVSSTPINQPTSTALPSAAAVVAAGKEPPACSFPLAQTTTTVSIPENYTFSEPQVVLTVSYPVDIYQWLPDNQRVLIGQESSQGQSIELFTPQTGKIQVFGSRGSSSDSPPKWVAGLNAVVYPQTVFVSGSRDSNGMIIPSTEIDKSQVLISRGDPANVQLLEELQPTTNASKLSIIVKPDGSQILYLGSGGNQLQQFYKRAISQGTLETVQPSPFNITQWTYRGPVSPPPVFGMAWRPGSTQIFLYSKEAWAGGYTFLLNSDSGQVCEFNLFGKDDPNDWRKSWAAIAHWSPNGRYLALVRTKGGLPIDFSDLIILDSATGKLYQMDATKLGFPGLSTQGEYFINDVAWAPDNHHLAVLGHFDPVGGNSMSSIDSLFLLDFLTDQSIQVSSQELGPNLDFSGDLLWSNDGSQVIAKCPSGLCLLAVQNSDQP